MGVGAGDRGGRLLLRADPADRRKAHTDVRDADGDRADRFPVFLAYPVAVADISEDGTAFRSVAGSPGGAVGGAWLCRGIGGLGNRRRQGGPAAHLRPWSADL